MTIDPHTTPEAVSTQIIDRAARALRSGSTYPRVNVSWDGLQYSNPDPITLAFAPSVVDVVVVDEGPRYQCCEHCAGDHTQIDPLNNHQLRCEVIFCRKGRRRAGIAVVLKIGPSLWSVTYPNGKLEEYIIDSRDLWDLLDVVRRRLPQFSGR